MNKLKTGQFFGTTNETLRLGGITLTDTEYTYNKVDWHFHENAYFTFIIEGNLIEGNRKELYNCNTGSLLFHNWHEAHYNIKPEGFTRGFHIELNPEWFDIYDIRTDLSTGNSNLMSPHMKILMYNIFKETKLTGQSAHTPINSLLIELFILMSGKNESTDQKKPLWVTRIKDLLNDSSEELTLTQIAKILNIHPVHLSRNFTKYFNCNLGDYLRTIKIQKVLSLLPNQDLSITQIAFQCNFADQSHFIRSFKALHNITPLHYRKLLLKN
jgi:AraC family transcriptional regulator